MAKLKIKAPPNKSHLLAKRIYSFQNTIVRELNNVHIFLEQAFPLLENAKQQYEQSRHKKDRRYYVPSVDRMKFARRTDKELKAIYDGYLERGLCEAFLVSALSQFENFLGDLLADVLVTYPQKLSIRTQDIPACPSISPAQLISADTKETLFNALIREHLGNVFRQRPKAYLTYLVAVVGGNDDPSFLDYYEVAATRDLVVHNDAMVNQLYLDKAGDKKRGQIGERLAVNRDYLYSALAKMKKVSGSIKREVERAYGSSAKSDDGA